MRANGREVSSKPAECGFHFGQAENEKGGWKTKGSFIKYVRLARRRGRDASDWRRGIGLDEKKPVMARDWSLVESAPT